MNPMTNVKNIQKLNENVLQMGVEDDVSWHKQYKDSAYVFLGGLPYDLTEGDILCVFSQYGEIVDINLVRDKSSGKFKGYGFLCYEDQRSTILAVDNLNGIKLGGRTIRVDHVANYKRPKGDERDEKGERKDLPLVGCAPTTPPGSDEDPDEEENDVVMEPKKKKKKKEKSKKRTKEKRKSEKGEVEERARARSPSAERWKIGRDNKELGGRTKTLGNTSEMDRDRKRYRDERSYRDRMNVDSYRRHDYKEKDREMDMREDVKYKGNIEERMKYRRDNERGRDKDTERRRYEDRNRK